MTKRSSGVRWPFFLRWSVIRMTLGMKKLMRDWQVGDGREQQAADYVLKHSREGDVDDVIATIDEFAYHESFLINVGDEKGGILDAALDRASPTRVLELGTYVGYSALRMARRLAPGAHIYSIEFHPENAAIARSVIRHAGMSERVTVVVGRLGDGGKTLKELEQKHGFGPASVDFVFLDHDKDAYLSDLQLLLGKGWLRKGAVAVADNILVPGVPKYRAYMQAQQGKLWRTEEHSTHTEYQRLVRDLMLESTLLEYEAA